jgi:hypothetical protein
MAQFAAELEAAEAAPKLIEDLVSAIIEKLKENPAFKDHFK